MVIAVLVDEKNDKVLLSKRKNKLNLKPNTPKEENFKILQNVKTLIHHQGRISDGVIWMLKKSY